MTANRMAMPASPQPSATAKRGVPYWYALMAVGGFGFGWIAERRPFGGDMLAHPLVVYFAVVGVALLALRIALARPVPDVIPDRALVTGCFVGLGLFLVGNLLAVRVVG
jgi:hypothetical protein